jgi:hypothetical protein
MTATSVCKVAGIANARDALSRLDHDGKVLGVGNADGQDSGRHSGRRRGQEKWWLTRPGFFSLVLTTRKPQAKARATQGCRTMERERPRWRVRISTLMLLVVIAALAIALVVQQMRWQEAERRAAVEVNGARLVAAEARRVVELARAQAEQAQMQLRKALDEAKGAGRRGE